MSVPISFFFLNDGWLRFVSNCYFFINFQPGKSLYTTVRELVENALDSSESISELPEVEVTMYVPTSFIYLSRIFKIYVFLLFIDCLVLF